MYIIYENQHYPCKCVWNEESITYRGLPENFPDSVSGDIILCANDGFELRADNTQNYSRQIFSNGILTLTNIPEPEAVPESPEPEPSAEELMDILLGVTE